MRWTGASEIRFECILDKSNHSKVHEDFYQWAEDTSSKCQIQRQIIQMFRMHCIESVHDLALCEGVICVYESALVDEHVCPRGVE